jgi:serine-type D-Ala-D-Ala endopeptidase (penicillin-binding protein 7)
MPKGVVGKLLSLCLAGTLVGLMPFSASAAAKTAVKKRAESVVGRKLTAVQAPRTTSLKRTAWQRPTHALVRHEPVRASMGQALGLHAAHDPLDLKSSVAFVLDQETNQVLIAKNAQAVLPIASITKLMTALVVLEAGLPLDEQVAVSMDDVDTEKGSRSRLMVGASLTRLELLNLSLMASENRAAHALGRSYPGGVQAFAAQMNRKARELGMFDTSFVEPTGLSSDNRSSGRDLATLVKAAYNVPLIRDLSVTPQAQVAVGNRAMSFRNTNSLVFNTSWEIGLQKTGYISEAGSCLVMQAQMAGRQLILVFLDSHGKYSRLGDAERVRRWLTNGGGGDAVRVQVDSTTKAEWPNS